MKQLLALFTLFAMTGHLHAQQAAADTTSWQKEMVGVLNLSQVTFDNWLQGGENTISWQVNLDASMEKATEQYNWSNTGKFSFGRTRVGDGNFRTSVDELKLESTMTYLIWKTINPIVAATAQTQVAPGYRYTDSSQVQISGFFDPAYFTESIGMEYKPAKWIKSRAGIALKQTIARDYPVPFADDPETPEIEDFRSEVGLNSVTTLNRKLNDIVLLKSKLELFSAFDGFSNTDVNWDSLLSAAIAKYININFNLRVLYDANVSKKRQIKQSVAVGLTYTFI